MGGFDQRGNKLSTVEMYDPEDGRWQEMSKLKGLRSRFAAIVL